MHKSAGTPGTSENCEQQSFEGARLRTVILNEAHVATTALTYHGEGHPGGLLHHPQISSVNGGMVGGHDPGGHGVQGSYDRVNNAAPFALLTDACMLLLSDSFLTPWNHHTQSGDASCCWLYVLPQMSTCKCSFDCCCDLQNIAPTHPLEPGTS